VLCVFCGWLYFGLIIADSLRNHCGSLRGNLG
jgi:hypothetical protein